MLYAQQADLLSCLTPDNLLRLADDLKAGTLEDPRVQSVIAGKLAEASSVVDSYCRNRYAIPLQASTDATAVARDLAVYGLYTRRPQAIPDGVTANRDNAMKFLRDIAAGKASLDSQTTAPQAATDGGVAPSRNDERFTEHNLRGFC